MKASGIAFRNLRAEMSRENINIVDIANTLGMNRDTLARKLSKKSPIYLDEAFLIQQKVFPNLDIKYLFSEHSTQDAS